MMLAIALAPLCASAQTPVAANTGEPYVIGPEDVLEIAGMGQHRSQSNRSRAAPTEDLAAASCTTSPPAA
jgi:hypothetical protein